MTLLPPPPTARDAIVDWVDEHLGHLSSDETRASPIRGGQAAADAALSALDITGYASRRNEVQPVRRRGATRLSPYIRHGLLSLPDVWAHVADAPIRDRKKFRDELLWQEYARHVYARVGRANGEPLRFDPPTDTGPWRSEHWHGEHWPEQMACMQLTTGELHDDGWLVNQTRMWLASQYTVRAGGDWREGERAMFRHLLDGSAAANRLGWQWTIGTGTGKVYGFSRWQVEKRAPGVCATCPLECACPVQQWPSAQSGRRIESQTELSSGTTDSGPSIPVITGEADTVWLTGESLGDTDPALLAHPDLPAVFVFDEPLLGRLQLSGKRLVFIAEALAELGCEVRLGDPVEELRGRALATTWTFVPGWKRRAPQLDIVALHPWRWLRQPGAGSLQSYSAWVR